MVAHQLLQSYRLLLGTTRDVMARRLPQQVRKARLIKSRDKATIGFMVAKLDKLEETYSPHKAPAAKDERVRGLSPAEQAELLGPGQQGGCTTGSLQAKPDVPGPGQQGGRTTGSLHAKPDVPGPGQQGGRTTGSSQAKSDVLGPGQEGGCTTGSLHAEGDVLGPCHPPYPTVDWSMVRWKPTLPNPVQCPILGVSQDPDFYMEKKGGWGAGSNYNLHSVKNPFSSLPGYQTSRGVVAVPTTPVGGWLYSMELGNWVLHACPPGNRRRGSRGSRR